MAKFYVVTPKNIEELKELQKMQEFVLKTLEEQSVDIALNKELTKDIKVFLFNVAGNGIYNLLCDLLQKQTDFYNGNPNTYKLLYDVWSSREIKKFIEMSCKSPKLVEEK
jgi:hypothetical protein